MIITKRVISKNYRLRTVKLADSSCEHNGLGHDEEGNVFMWISVHGKFGSDVYRVELTQRELFQLAKNLMLKTSLKPKGKKKK